MIGRNGLIRIAVGVLLGLSGVAFAQGDPGMAVEGVASPGQVFTYQGRLDDGGAPAEGAYDLLFMLYGSAIGGSPLFGPEAVPDVTVEGGVFTVALDFGEGVFDGTDRYLEIGVMKKGAAGYTLLSPRQLLTPVPYAYYAASAPAAPHNHWGEVWMGSGTGLRLISSDGSGFYAESSFSNGVYATSTASGGKGVYGVATSPTGYNAGVWGQSASSGGRGVLGWATAFDGMNHGVMGLSNSRNGRGVTGIVDSATGVTYAIYGECYSDAGTAVYGSAAAQTGLTTGVTGVSGSSQGWGVYGFATSNEGQTRGVFGTSNSFEGVGVYGLVPSPTGETYGVYGQSESNEGCGVYGETFMVPPLEVSIAGVVGRTAAYGNGSHGVMGRSDNEYGVGVFAYHSGPGVALRVTSDSGDPIEAFVGDEFRSNRVFHVDSAGEVYADGNFNAGGADFAEMLPAGEGLEAGDVLVVGEDGKLVRSTRPNQANVVGVYSTKPGFVGGRDGEEDLSGKVPLAIMGIVPVKVVSENGLVRPGDRLVTSSVRGHAMKAGANPENGTIVGKALEGLEGDGGTISMLVMLQ